MPTHSEGLSAVKARWLAAVATVLLLGSVCALRFEQWQNHATARPAEMIADQPSPPVRVPFAWQAAYRGALETDSGFDGALVVLARDRADLQRTLRAAHSPLPAEESEAAELETAWRTLRSRSAAVQSLALEMEATKLADSGDDAGALEKLTAALGLQDEANTIAPSGKLKDFPREARLRTSVELRAARPQRAQVAEARRRADAALAAGDTAGATRALREAQAWQQAVNQDFRDTKAAAPAAVAGLALEIETLESRDLAKRVQAVAGTAEKFADVSHAAEAGRAWAEAAALQLELNRRFPKSRDASPARAEEFEVNRQTAFARPLHAQVAALDAQAAESLRRRAIGPAIALLDEAAALLDRAVGEFPRSAEWNPALARKIEFLTLKRRELAPLQEQARQMLVPLARSPGLAITRQEVSQAMFVQVMHANPSRTRGPVLPVESVNWHEAAEFCQRLSWVLGASVRLPTEPEFRLMATETVATHADDYMPWIAMADFGGWLQATAGSGATAPVGGRAVAKTVGSPRITVATRAKDYRARSVGFWFVTETPRTEQLALSR